MKKQLKSFLPAIIYTIILAVIKNIADFESSVLVGIVLILVNLEKKH